MLISNKVVETKQVPDFGKAPQHVVDSKVVPTRSMWLVVSNVFVGPPQCT